MQKAAFSLLLRQVQQVGRHARGDDQGREQQDVGVELLQCEGGGGVVFVSARVHRASGGAQRAARRRRALRYAPCCSARRGLRPCDDRDTDCLCDLITTKNSDESQADEAERPNESARDLPLLAALLFSSLLLQVDPWSLHRSTNYSQTHKIPQHAPWPPCGGPGAWQTWWASCCWLVF